MLHAALDVITVGWILPARNPRPLGKNPDILFPFFPIDCNLPQCDN
jgi:hypothetical protein